MSETKKTVTRKKVTIICHHPFRVGQIPYSGTMRNVVLSTQEISTCLENKCSVVEVLDNGTTVPLDFSNYNTYNGPTKVTEETQLFYEKSQQKIPVIENGKVINENARDTSKKKTIILGSKINIDDEVEIKQEIKKSEPVKSDISGKVQMVQEVSTSIPTTREIEKDKKEETIKSSESDNIDKKEFDYNSNNFTNNKKKNKF